MPVKKTKEQTNLPGTNVTAEQVTEVTKKRKRGFDALTDFNAEPGDNSRFIRFALTAWNLPPIDISDPKQVEQRIGEYFQHCADNDRRPQVVGMCNWLGISRDTLNKWVNGETRNTTHSDIIKKAYAVMEEMWTDYMQYGKISPPTAIFLAKNWYAYKDVADVVVTPNNPMSELDADTARQRMIEAVPDDEDE